MTNAPRLERVAWLALLAVAALWRFADLDSRAMGHDESLHAYYSYRYADLGEFRHDPLLHGPFLFHAQALVFALLGDGDATARLLPAFAGVLLVGAPWLFRREIGRRGAFAAGVLLLLSPAVAVYSRYLRNDVWCALFALLWARALLDYRQRGEPRALRWLALAMALSFASKEVAFLTGAGFGAACLLAAAGEIASRAATWRDSRWLDLAVLQAVLVAPYLSAVAILAAGADPSRFDAPGAAGRSALWGGLLGAAALALALLRCRGSRRALARPLLGAFALFWGILLPLYTSLGTNLGRGLASGVAGSLGYWLAQHGVERGGQPAFFYVLLMALYEPLVWALSVAGGVLAWRRLRGRGSAAAAAGEESAESLRCALLVTLWCGAAWFGYSLAGERMPWLLVHIVVPSTLVAGWWLERRLPVAIDALERRRVAALAIAAAAALLLAAGLVGRDAAPAAELVRAVLLVAATGFGLTLVVRTAVRDGRAVARRVALLGLLGAALLLGARTALVASFAHSELAVETLVYAHGTPAVKPALAELERSSRQLAGGLDLEVAYDFETSWPLAWYLRRYPRARGFVAGAGAEPDVRALEAPALLLGDAADRAARPALETARPRLAFDILWWPVDAYRSWTLDDLPRLAGDPASLRRAVAFYFFRELPGIPLEPWPLRKGAALYLPRPEPGADARAAAGPEPTPAIP